MYIDKDSLTVTGGGKTLNLGTYILEAKYSYNKIWSEDSGRNLKGTMSGTLVGIFPKIIVQFKRLSKTELEDVSKVLDSATQSVTYYDPYKKATRTMSTYTGDWEVSNKGILLNDGFSVSFISRSKRT